MVVQNPNNWHWVDKNCISWARDYFKEKLVGLQVTNEQCRVEITSMNTLEGDCEVSQRKGKVISLFDLQMGLSYSGELDGEKFEGSINIPEIAFDSSTEDYQFEVAVFKETSKLNQEVKPLIREQLVPRLRNIFSQFGEDLLITHGNDIQVSEDEVKSNFTRANQKASFEQVKKAPPSDTPTGTTAGTSTATPSSVASASASAKKEVLRQGPEKTVVNTSEIHLEPSFNVPASELLRTFVDKMRLQQFSRSELRLTKGDSSAPVLSAGDEYQLFGGNVCTRIVSVSEKSLVMQWRLADWSPSSWHSTMHLEFHESKEYHETKLEITWRDIPVGQEDRVRQNFENYYVRAIKLTFGFGAVL
ncbi:Aha1p [Nakaseomyces bracarensis]|uniref:Aha1p n=1 Tax=Nakaseomyces bracarensis TaxID=273131 RepID=UPI0038710236